MKNLKLRFKNSQDCAKAQEIILSHGITWRDGSKIIHRTERWLTIVHDGYMFTDSISENKEIKDKQFNKYPGEEISLLQLQEMEKPVEIQEISENIPNIRIYKNGTIFLGNEILKANAFKKIADAIV